MELHPKNPTTLTDLERLRELRKKYHQMLPNSYGTYISALISYFDLPSTQAMLEKAGREESGK